MENIYGKIKNWALPLLGTLLLVLDLGFNEINPLLVEFGLNPRWIGIIKVAFGAYGIYKIKKSLPTQNVEKLKEIVIEKEYEELQ